MVDETTKLRHQQTGLQIQLPIQDTIEKAGTITSPSGMVEEITKSRHQQTGW